MQGLKVGGKTLFVADPSVEGGRRRVALLASAAEANTVHRALSVLNSLIADIEAMHFPLRLDEFDSPDIDSDAFFGAFTDYYDNGDLCMVSEGAGIRIYWPNLRILLEDAKQALKDLAGDERITSKQRKGE